MSTPATPLVPAETPGIDTFLYFPILSIILDRQSRTRSGRRRRSLSAERPESTIVSLNSPVPPLTARRRPQSTARGDMTAATPFQLTDDVQQQVSMFVEDNFDIETSTKKKIPKHRKGKLSARTDFTAYKSPIDSARTPITDHEQKQTVTNTNMSST